MARTSDGKRETNEQRVRHLQDQLQRLDPTTPFYARERALLTRELQLMKTQSPQPPRGSRQQKVSPKRAGVPAKSGNKNKKRPGSLPDTKNTPTDALGNGLGNMLSPKNFQESMNTISTLRGWSKQVAKYVQQADNLLDTLFITANSLQESGVLKKLAESKGKNLSTADLTSILMALMNSPLGNSVFKKLGGNSESTSATKSAEHSTPPSHEAEVPALPPATTPYNTPVSPHSAMGPPYGMPPGGRPI
ncbi:hypothetical protein [Sulfoacidibacillus thermotolerans]|uniref:Uncharacterized protein n=1 Tax=Sulfoacidibacillus thermotolerans TaxID=1765684 RepID=A0A2U3D9I6_SULT2|nr:hypothetical protein [Sulfoacidibacillus thermotolerans]PWI57935.1 hypothetical protein BM613_05860 [Sulfoacidibacillus thermotolerans]